MPCCEVRMRWMTGVGVKVSLRFKLFFKKWPPLVFTLIPDPRQLLALAPLLLFSDLPYIETDRPN